MTDRPADSDRPSSLAFPGALKNRIRRMLPLNSSRYHGALNPSDQRRRPFFEGWYFKLIDRSENERLVVIPGVFFGKKAPREKANSSDEGQGDHAFIQLFDGSRGEVRYISYPIQEFAADLDRFSVRIGNSLFERDRLRLDIRDGDFEVQGEARFSGLTTWPESLISPGIMGPYSWAPLMECYHGVLSLDHDISGEITAFGRKVDYSGGRGYIEKDWGGAFPKAWVWCQTNLFLPDSREEGSAKTAPSPRASLSASVAIIPWLTGAFPGFIVGFYYEGRLYRFASYTGARIDSLKIDDRQVEWSIVGRRYRLDLVLERARGGLLRAPNDIDMGRRISETLDATARVRLSRLGQKPGASGEVVFSGVGRYAGLEVAGNLDLLRAMVVSAGAKG